MTPNFWLSDVQLASFPARRDSEQFAQTLRHRSHFNLRHDACTTKRSDIYCTNHHYWEETIVSDVWPALKPKNGVCCLRWKKRPLTCDTLRTASLFLGFLGVGGGSWHTPLGGHVTRAAINPSTPAREGRYQAHPARPLRFSQPYSDVLREYDNKIVLPFDA